MSARFEITMDFFFEIGQSAITPRHGSTSSFFMTVERRSRLRRLLYVWGDMPKMRKKYIEI
jgi:hypothetical protein